MKLYVTLNEDGLFCIARELRGETERMACDTEHLREELQAMGADCIAVPELKKEYAMREL